MANLQKSITGFNKKTAESLLLNAGAFFKNYDIKTDTVETAKEKLLGATRDGGSFEAKPTIRQIKADGVRGKAKGLEVLENWEVKLEANVLELTKENLITSLATAQTETAENDKYDKIVANNYISLDNYIDNITYIGTLSGSNEPIIIQVYNTINMEGLSLDFKDNDEAVNKMSFEGHYDINDLDHPPFAIYYPKKQGGK